MHDNDLLFIVSNAKNGSKDNKGFNKTPMRINVVI